MDDVWRQLCFFSNQETRLTLRETCFKILKIAIEFDIVRNSFFLPGPKTFLCCEKELYERITSLTLNDEYTQPLRLTGLPLESLKLGHDYNQPLTLTGLPLQSLKLGYYYNQLLALTGLPLQSLELGYDTVTHLF